MDREVKHERDGCCSPGGVYGEEEGKKGGGEGGRLEDWRQRTLY